MITRRAAEDLAEEVALEDHLAAQEETQTCRQPGMLAKPLHHRADL